ncbi:hypothetical protein EI42_05840 [Thermosporothrix hazakensis]|uniref:Uncharacterized protein n=1 Tax=Thermosporothrix hazakensis TaxID=644383 RepID=A0A326TVE3_THEHA|nr:hypothetical protein EI42_05840 [Thermosporothrix hazakensis]
MIDFCVCLGSGSPVRFSCARLPAFLAIDIVWQWLNSYGQLLNGRLAVDSRCIKGGMSQEAGKPPQYRRDVLPDSCVRRYAAIYAHSFVLGLTRVPQHRSSVASPKLSGYLFSGFAAMELKDNRMDDLERLVPPLSLLDHSSTEDPDTRLKSDVLRH